MSGNKQIPKIVVLGLGNILFRDEGFGVHVIRALRSRYSFSPSVDIIDGGTAGISLSGFVSGVDLLIAVDCLASDASPGSLFIYENDELVSAPGVRMSPHQVGFLEMLDLLDLQGMKPLKVILIGAVGCDLNSGLHLSPALYSTVKLACDKIVELLEGAGVRAVLKEDVDNA